jgi:hypothetical protein
MCSNVDLSGKVDIERYLGTGSCHRHLSKNMQVTQELAPYTEPLVIKYRLSPHHFLASRFASASVQPDRGGGVVGFDNAQAPVPRPVRLQTSCLNFT